MIASTRTWERRAFLVEIEKFCRWKFMDKVKGFGEADAFPSDDAEARRIWPEFTRQDFLVKQERL
jgi:hypothetical protein